MRVLRRGAGAGMIVSGGMRNGFSNFRLLLLGAGARLVGAAVIVALLWLGFFWATSALGAS